MLNRCHSISGLSASVGGHLLPLSALSEEVMMDNKNTNGHPHPTSPFASLLV